MSIPTPTRTLLFDTETTGLLPRRGERPINDATNPHLVQLGALMMVPDSTQPTGFREAGLFHCLIRPDNWTIPAEATAIHGITTEMCNMWGLDIIDALMIFREMTRLCGRLVAHNYEFDACLLDIEFRRLGQQGFLYNDGRAFCTMKASTEICKIQGTHMDGMGAGRKFTKYPKLKEAHQFFLGQPFEGEHSAIGDVRACWAVYCKLQEWIANQNATVDGQRSAAL